MNYQSENLKVRWFNDACYELKLPNGKGILIDPYINGSRYRVKSVEDVEAADYILISHTHFDHVMDIGEVSQTFDSKIFAGNMSGMELAKYFDIPGYRMNLCSPGDVIFTEDFKLECFRAKHTKLGDFDRPSNWPENLKQENLKEEAAAMNLAGSYEYLNYLLTLPSGFRVLVWGGGATIDGISHAKEYRPDVSIAQLPRESTDDIADLYGAIGGRVIFPHHHDTFLEMGMEGMGRIEEVVEKTAERAPDTMVICPEKGKWYQIVTTVKLMEE